MLTHVRSRHSGFAAPILYLIVEATCRWRGLALCSPLLPRLSRSMLGRLLPSFQVAHRPVEVPDLQARRSLADHRRRGFKLWHHPGRCRQAFYVARDEPYRVVS